MQSSGVQRPSKGKRVKFAHRGEAETGAGAHRILPRNTHGVEVESGVGAHRSLPINTMASR